MGKSTHPHWLSPVSMVAGLAAGIAFAVGHHAFYSHLEGQQVSTAKVLGSSVTKQEFNIAVGTAFAFLVKACLVSSMAVAFVQLFWREARHAIEAPTLSRLDNMYSAFFNVVGLFSLPVWLKYPLLVMVAVLSWIVPIASIITPATLSIQNAAAQPFSVVSRRVPNLDFRSMNFLAAMPKAGDYTDTPNLATYLYNGPNQPLLETSNAVMAGGQILPIMPPAPNSSWILQLTGPSLKCENVDDNLHQQIRQNIAQGINDSAGPDLYGYLSWFPSSGWWNRNLTSDVPFLSEGENAKIVFTPSSLGPSLDNNATIFVAAMPQVFAASQPEIFKAFNKWNGSTPSWLDGTIFQCSMYNSTYRVVFEYVEGEQNVNISLVNPEQDLQVVPQSSMLGPNPHNLTENGCENAGSITSEQTSQCYSNPEMLRTFSYQAIMDAFSSNLKGAMFVNSGQQLQRESNIMNTALLKTPELSFLRTRAASATFGNETMQAEIQAINDQYTQGLISKETTNSSQPLASAIEEMFRNYTISLMSSPALQPNYSSITAPPPSQVTMPAYHNIYSYSAYKLWAAYGAAIFLSALSTFLGFVALLLNGASYSHSFSTVFRVSRGAQLDAKIRADDMKGEDPLPKHLAEAKVRFEASKGEEDEFLSYKRQNTRIK